MPETITTSRLGPEHLQEALQNVRLFWEKSPSEGKLLAFLRQPHNILVAARVSGQPAGQALGYILPRWDANPPMLFLYSIDVLPLYRRQGVGRTLIETIRRIGREAGCGKTFVLTSEDNAPAMSLYTAAGARRPHDDDVMFVWEEPS